MPATRCLLPTSATKRGGSANLYGGAFCLLLSSCTVITPMVRHVLPSRAEPLPMKMLDDGSQDYTGVIHVHTTYSHDAHGSFDNVVRTANAQGLHYVIITEHNTLQPLRDGKQGWHGAVLVLIGVELSTRGGHYLAFNVHEEIDRYQPTQAVIDEVNRQGGFGFIAHPYFAKGRWSDWTVTGVAGIEAYNVAHDTIDENKLRLVLWTLLSPREPFYLSILNRPYDPLAMWDRLIAQRGPFVGIGATDAHEFHALGLTFAPYDDMFRLVRTHVLIPDGTALSETAIYDALRQGHTYFSIDMIAEVRQTQFMAQQHDKLLGIMGDEITLVPGLELAVWLPAAASLHLYRNGTRIATTIGSSWRLPVTEPGAYRIEAFRHNNPWIFSNPIYVRPAPSDQPPAPVPHAP